MTLCMAQAPRNSAESVFLPAETPPVRTASVLSPLALALSLALLLPACSRPAGDASAPTATESTAAATPEQIAAESGFASAQVLRKAFLRVSGPV